MQYTVLGAAFKKDVNGKFGPMKVYRIKFAESTETLDYLISAKTPMPEPGDKLDGNIEQGDYGPYFKKSPAPAPSAGGWREPYKAHETRNKSDSLYTMFVSYTKDLMIEYLNSLNWDLDKIDEAKFGKMLDTMGRLSHRLQESESQTQTTPTAPKNDIFDPFTMSEEDI